MWFFLGCLRDVTRPLRSWLYRIGRSALDNLRLFDVMLGWHHSLDVLVKHCQPGNSYALLCDAPSELLGHINKNTRCIILASCRSSQPGVRPFEPVLFLQLAFEVTGNRYRK